LRHLKLPLFSSEYSFYFYNWNIFKYFDRQMQEDSNALKNA
jgi:hypothetical protein